MWLSKCPSIAHSQHLKDRQGTEAAAAQRNGHVTGFKHDNRCERKRDRGESPRPLLRDQGCKAGVRRERDRESQREIRDVAAGAE